jgi:tRNA(fMet)-specific endonuclease VapC
MSLYVLDTDILSLYEQGQVAVCMRVDAQPDDHLATTVMTAEERLSGWYRRLRTAKNQKDLASAYDSLAGTIEFLGGWRILSFTEPAITRFKQLKALKLNVGSSDLSIAAITLENGGILVTRNTRDFQRVPGLTIENWAI